MDTYGFIYIRVKHYIRSIRPDSILYMEKRNRKIVIHFSEEEDICFYGKYDSILPMLDRRFVHPHQSYVINMQQIHCLGNQSVVMFGGDRIEMGSRCFGRLRKAFEEYISRNVKARPAS